MNFHILLLDSARLLINSSSDSSSIDLELDGKIFCFGSGFSGISNDRESRLGTMFSFAAGTASRPEDFALLG